MEIAFLFKFREVSVTNRFIFRLFRGRNFYMGTKLVLLLVLIALISFSLSAQESLRKKITALRIDVPLKIDGILNESSYNQAEIATDFVQLMPYNGKPSYKPTEVKILYDDDAIYIGAMLYDDPDSIQSYITTRDNIGVSDYFVFFIDPNNEGLTAYEFIVTPANSQTDIKAIKGSNGDNEDSSWDDVWQSATNINDKGWSLELKIPYSALRFSVKENPVWGLNFFRRIRRYNSNNSWNMVHQEISGFIQQSGELHGLKDINAPVRLSVSPYVATYVKNHAGTSDYNFQFKGGVDLKYGLSESHTLDMMLIPDFGQIQSDDEELNLSPYELFYDEKRQFFVEGTELFNRVGMFYSRRIGGEPKFNDIEDSKLKANEKVTYNPNETQLINATKISGRDKNGWGVGFLNAMSLSGKAIITDTLTGKTRELVTQPFTNYNVTVVEKALSNNSFISLLNTNMAMVNSSYLANVTGSEFQLKNSNQTYQLSGKAALSYRSEAEDKTGYLYKLSLSKVKGKFKFLIDHTTVNDKFDPNDMGYIQRNNEISDDAQISYNIHEPFGIFKSWYGHVRIENTMLFSPTRQVENQMRFWTEATFKNNWWAGLFFGHSFGNHDYYETRVTNRYFRNPSYNMFELNLQTDNDKKLSGFLCAGGYDSKRKGDYGFWGNGNLWWKATQHFNFYYDVSTNLDFGNFGYVDDHNRDSVYFGGFIRNTLENTLTMAYSFNTKMKIDFRCRHYWSLANYNSYYFLNTDGSLSLFPEYPENEDKNYNAFSIDMTYKWEFAPGSELSVAWKNSISEENDMMKLSYFKNFKETLAADQLNSISVKILYYLDYKSIVKHRPAKS